MKFVPTKPGLGVELDEKACERYPHKNHHIPFFDGNLNAELRGDYQPFLRAAAESMP